MPFGAEIEGSGRVRFRLWAPAARQTTLLIMPDGCRETHPMRDDGDGWHAAEVSAAAGARYAFLVGDGPAVPDPASRFQPEGPAGPSEVIDPGDFAWEDAGWRGRPWEEAVLYELHVGAFTAGGDFQGALARLDHLAELGVTAIELMPLAECPGRWNWGYDGVLLFAPASRYGRPEKLKQFVQSAHQRGLMVLLDVVYNHFGPEENHIARYAPDFFTDRRRTPWGAAIDFEGPRSRTVRDFFVHNALYWLDEYHLDGLRLDAVHTIHDTSEPDILREIAERVRARFEGERHVHLVLENDENDPGLLERRSDGRPRWFTAQWNDDLHHAMHVLVTGERDGYYVDYADSPARCLGRALTEGFAYQGEASSFRGGARRGAPSAHLPPTAFVGFLQNHDQIGNRPFGRRILEFADAQAARAAAEVLLLAPSVPMLFMGEGWGSDQRFPFFCDFRPPLAERVRKGRRREFAGFRGFREPEARERIPDPTAEETFESAVLAWQERHREPHASWVAFHRELLSIRQREIIPRLAGMPGGGGSFEAIGEAAIHARWRLGDASRLALIANLAAKTTSARVTRPEGRLLFASHAAIPEILEEGELPPWSVAWFLDPDAEAPGR